MIKNDLQELLKLTWEKAGKTEKLLRPGSKSDLSGLPSSLRELYSIADGQKDESTQLFEHYTFISGKDCIESKKFLDDLSIEEGWKEIGWWEETWFPFGDDGMGQYLVVDADSGRVLEFLHDSPERPVLAESLEAYLQNLISDLQSGVSMYDSELGIVNTKQFEQYQKDQKESQGLKRKIARFGSLLWKSIKLIWTIAVLIAGVSFIVKKLFF